MLSCFMVNWTKYCSPALIVNARTKASPNGKRPHHIPRPFVSSMRRAAMDQGRWYLVLCELRSATVKPRSAPLHARLLEHWEKFGQTLRLPPEDVMKTAQRSHQAQFCHNFECNYNAGKAPQQALKKCIGCGEAYYCSKECQKR